ncbi:MAG: hypothetical protein HPZ79_02655 [Oscillospiraceae bacterium]|nr:hypothetical protein [Oscillospiraceae bacterium]
MFEQMKWENAYELWQRGSCYFPQALTAPVSAETVFVEYKQNGYIYGYDWLEAEDAQKRKQLIENNPIEFLYFTKPSNKGTIQTAEMLMEAQNEEELAAVWIAATAKELSEYMIGNGVGHYANMLHMAACEFLRTRYVLWHHAMKRLVPDITIPSSVLENIVCKDAEPVMGLIQMNTVLLKSTWSILRYSSLKDGELQEFHFRISPE